MSESPEDIGLPLVRANLVWDLVSQRDVPRMLRMLDMTPPGPDGVKIAATESRMRADMVRPIQSAIEILAREITEIYIKAMLGEAASEIDDETALDLYSAYEDFLVAALKVGIANLMHVGILTYNTRILG